MTQTIKEIISDPIKSTTYQKFLSESPEFLICRYGQSNALGMRGSHEVINKAHILFCNYDTSKALHWLSGDFAYITIAESRILSAIKLFLHANILHSGEIPTETLWDEENGIYSLKQDIVAVEELSSRCAQHFVTNIKVQSFIPSEYSTPSYEFADPFESYRNQ